MWRLRSSLSRALVAATECVRLLSHGHELVDRRWPRHEPLRRSAQHAVPRKVHRHHGELEEDLARRLGLQPEAVGGRRDDLLLLEARAAAEEEGCGRDNKGARRSPPSVWHMGGEGRRAAPWDNGQLNEARLLTGELLAQRAARPPRGAAQLVRSGGGGHDAAAVAHQLHTPVHVDAVHLDP